MLAHQRHQFFIRDAADPLDGGCRLGEDRVGPQLRSRFPGHIAGARGGLESRDRGLRLLLDVAPRAFEPLGRLLPLGIEAVANLPLEAEHLTERVLVRGHANPLSGRGAAMIAAMITEAPLPDLHPAAAGGGEPIGIPDGELTLWPAAFTAAAADALFASLRQEVAWRSEEVMIFGQARRVPRLVAWYGDPLAVYTYSGTRHQPLPWTPAIAEVRARVAALAGRCFNSVLLNLYRGGADGMGWHADDEPELGPNPVIASVSLGAVRRFRLRHRCRGGQALALDLPHGSLLLMGGALQHHWVHAIPKTRRPVGERINLTFRAVAATPVTPSGRPLPPARA